MRMSEPRPKRHLKRELSKNLPSNRKLSLQYICSGDGGGARVAAAVLRRGAGSVGRGGARAAQGLHHVSGGGKICVIMNFIT